MKPIDFPESNKVLQRPDTMTDEECQPLHIFTDQNCCLSCWEMSFKERLIALFTGRIWLSVYSGATQPPVWLMPGKTVFEIVDAEFDEKSDALEDFKLRKANMVEELEGLRVAVRDGWAIPEQLSLDGKP